MNLLPSVSVSLAADRLQQLGKNHSDDTYISPHGPSTPIYGKSGSKPSAIGWVQEKLFRTKTDEEKKINKIVFDQVENDIKTVYGDHTANVFSNTMSWKKSCGISLSKGALVRFLKTQNFSLDVAHKNTACNIIESAIAECTCAKFFSWKNDPSVINAQRRQLLIDKLTSLEKTFANNQDDKIRNFLETFTTYLNQNDESPQVLDILLNKKTPTSKRIELIKNILNPPSQTDDDDS